MRGSRRIGLLAVSVACVFAFMVSSAAADPNLFYTNSEESQALPDASGNNGGEAGFGYPIEFVNSGNLKITATGFSEECTEAELDTYLNHNTEALGVEAALVAGQFECEKPMFLATPSGAGAVFSGSNSVTVTNLELLVQAGEANCIFRTKAAGIKGTWANAVGGEEELGSTIKFSEQELSGSGTGCPATVKLTTTVGAETFTQAESFSAFDTEQVFYGT